MRLSEAIRLGAMMKPQAFGELYNGVGTCVVGAACDAIGIAYGHSFVEAFPVTKTLVNLPCPECREVRPECWPLDHLNDVHYWTRERIADWVESIENAQTPAEAQTVEQQA